MVFPVRPSGATPEGLLGRRNAEVFQIEHLTKSLDGRNRGTVVDFVAARTSRFRSFQQPGEILVLNLKGLQEGWRPDPPGPEPGAKPCRSLLKSAVLK